MWKFTVDKGMGHTEVHEFKSGQWFVESRELGVYDCKYTFVKPFVFRFTLKPRYPAFTILHILTDIYIYTCILYNFNNYLVYKSIFN